MPQHWRLQPDYLRFIYRKSSWAIDSYGTPVKTYDKTNGMFGTFVFSFNPQAVAVNYNKINVDIPTKSGFVTQQWFAGMETFTFNGETEPFIGPNALHYNGEGFAIGNEVTNLKNTAQYRMFWLLDQYIKSANDDIIMVYDGAAYDGIFQNFSYNETADDPFSIKYTFTYRAYPYIMGSQGALPTRWTVSASTKNGDDFVDITSGKKAEVSANNKNSWNDILTTMQQDLVAFESNI